VLLIAAAAWIMETKNSAPVEAPGSISQLPTKRIRQHDFSALPSSDPHTEQSPIEETISAARRHSSTHAKQQVENSPEIIQLADADTHSSPQPSPMPLAYRIDETKLGEKFPHVPSAILSSIKDDFEKELGPDQLDPASPEYARRWQSAELMAAARLRAYYGWAAYAGMQKNAVLGN